jgi:hypothetical protein
MKFLVLFIFICILIKSFGTNPVKHNDQEGSLQGLNNTEKEEVKMEVMIEDEIGSRFVFPDDVPKEIEKNDLYQGDIILTEEQRSALHDETGTRTGIRGERYRWPKYRDGLVRVPYLIDNTFCK